MWTALADLGTRREHGTENPGVGSSILPPVHHFLRPPNAEIPRWAWRFVTSGPTSPVRTPCDPLGPVLIAGWVPVFGVIRLVFAGVGGWAGGRREVLQARDTCSHAGARPTGVPTPRSSTPGPSTVSSRARIRNVSLPAAGRTDRPQPASGPRRRGQLQHHAVAITPTQPVDEHRHRQLPAVLALQRRQGSALERLVVHDTPCPPATRPGCRARSCCTGQSAPGPWRAPAWPCRCCWP
jgi:hypothetical protein